jgi:hypothetical protein
MIKGQDSSTLVVVGEVKKIMEAVRNDAKFWTFYIQNGASTMHTDWCWSNVCTKIGHTLFDILFCLLSTFVAPNLALAQRERAILIHVSVC